MSIWFFLLIPIIGAAILLKFFGKKLAWWEVSIPLLACFFFISIFKLIVEKVQVNDTEYHGALIVKATYYESYSTWVEQTCSYTTTCCCDSKGGNCQTTTHYYDCSYCSTHNARWEVTNSLGESWGVNEDFYNYLMKKWSAIPQFVDMNRSINYYGGCGKDGDAYDIFWDKQWNTSEATTTSHWYENRVQAAHTSFDFVNVTKEDVSQYSLVKYPVVKSFQQNNILGADSISWFTSYEKNRLHQWGMYLNGLLGPKNHARIYYIFFEDQPHLAGKMQEAYWDGGNDNELVVCIGLSSKNKKIKWVYPFSWTPERKILVDMREDIMNLKAFDIDGIATITLSNVEKEWKRKDFKEFSYVTVDPPGWSMWVTFIITLIITGLLCYWAVVNEVDSRYDPVKDFFSDLLNRVFDKLNKIKRKT